MRNGPNLFRGGAPVQSLVYIFIALVGLAIGAIAYFGLTFSPIEAFVTGLGCVAIAVALLERTLRRRSEVRLERAVEELSRLLSTDAQAGAVLGQRINALVDENAGKRLEVVEADISVLGTVVRQVAEAVADIEEARERHSPKDATGELPARPPAIDITPQHVEAAAASSQPPARAFVPPLPVEPVMPLETLRQAIDDGRLIFHLQPVVALPQRKTFGYDLVPRLALEGGEFADAPDFLPRQGGEAVLRRIERQALEEAVGIARRASTAARSTPLYVPISRAILADAVTIEKIVALLDAHRTAVGNIALLIAEADWDALPLNEKAALAAFVGKGVKLALADCRSLRLDFARLAGEGVTSVRVDARPFLASPETFTDFHTADVAPYIRRFEMELIASGVTSEEQLLMLLEDGVGLVQGPHVSPPSPERLDLAANRQAAARPRFSAEA
jgi:cyclic-di-GMP phosphodiesterase TipF (flagellum assembly factor)